MRACVRACVCACVRECVCVCGGGWVCGVCVCVLSVIVKRPVLLLCAVDGRSRNPILIILIVLRISNAN